MKRARWIVGVAALVLILGAGCEQISEIGKPVVVVTVTNSGATLHLTWTAVTDAEGYRIKAGDSTWTTTSTSFDVSVPAKKVEVTAYSGTLESDPWTLDCAVEETSTLVLYGISDPDPNHPSGLAFTTSGTATALSLSTANKPSIDFVCDDQNITPVGLVNAGDYTWPENSKGNALKNSGSANYDDVKIADAPGAYTTQLTISAGAVYYLWLDHQNNNWDVTDHFAKAKVVSIEDVGGSKKVTLKLGYQKVGGLRWLVN
ncbi:MAG: hypothetical protein ABIL25_05555 [candidate division WOR-3 bacterium]